MKKVFLALLLVVSFLPRGVWAEGEGPPAFSLEKDLDGQVEDLGTYEDFSQALKAIQDGEAQALYTLYVQRDLVLETTYPTPTLSSRKLQLKSREEAKRLVLQGSMPLVKLKGGAQLSLEDIKISRAPNLGGGPGPLIQLEGGSSLSLGRGLVLEDIKTLKSKKALASAIYVGFNSRLHIQEGALIWNNEATEDQQALIFVGPTGQVHIEGGHFENNGASHQGGLIRSTGSVKIDGGSFIKNHADKEGGVLYQEVGSLEIQGGHFEGNTATKGGALYLGPLSQKTLQGALFKNNQAHIQGGALYLEDRVLPSSRDLVIKKTLFEGNQAQEGGALFIGANTRIEAASFIKNVAQDQGGAIYAGPLPYTDPLDDPGAYKGLEIEGTCLFQDNRARAFYRPPKNYQDFGGALAFKTTSFSDKEDPTLHPSLKKSLLNNYDLNYLNPLSYVFYLPYEGAETSPDRSQVLETLDEKGAPRKVAYRVPSREALGLEREGYSFLGWNSQADGQGQTYQEGDELWLEGDTYLYGQWEEDPSKNLPTLGHKKPSPPKKTHPAYLKGYPDGTFRPHDPLSRAEAVGIFARLVEASPVKEPAYKRTYTDVSQEAWYYRDLVQLVDLGLLEGYPDGTFAPKKSLSRAEFLALASRLEKDLKGGRVSFRDLKEDHWAYGYICSGLARGWVQGYPDKTFRPDEPISRAEASCLLNRVLGRQPDLDLMEKNKASLPLFKDLKEDHWAFYEIMEASWDRESL
ncbi:MAG: S-layer homology domain-containing protein [Tissierellia bacterium]|nr:S-layer homology domain-containing protein [Tissierellia bacterium]